MSHASVVMVSCPTTGRELSTGVEMDAATFERLPDIHSQIKCPLCRLDHNWSTRQAWLGNPAPSIPAFPWLFINNQSAANDQTRLIRTYGRMSKARASIKKAPRARRQMTGSEVGRRAGVIASVRSGSTELRVEVLGDEIIVILPATSYGVTYYKPTHSAHLLVKNFLSKIDRGAPMTQEKFLARAWQAANEKAHELGWIMDPGR